MSNLATVLTGEISVIIYINTADIICGIWQPYSQEKCVNETVTSQQYLAYDIISTESVLIHDCDDDGGLSQHMSRNIERKGLVKHWVQTPLHYDRLLLFHSFVFVHQPHFHIGV